MDVSKEEREQVMRRLKQRRRAALNPEKIIENSYQSYKNRQHKTRDAVAKGRPWMREDYAAAFDMTRTDVEIALALGRTAASVVAARFRRPDLRPANYVSKRNMRIDEPVVEQTVTPCLKPHTSVATAEELQKGPPPPRRYRRWTPEERLALFDMTKTNKEIAASIGRHVSCIPIVRRLSKDYAPPGYQPKKRGRRRKKQTQVTD